jgi:hypothetical protein
MVTINNMILINLFRALYGKIEHKRKILPCPVW